MGDQIVTVPMPAGSYPATVYGEEVTLELHFPDPMTEYLRQSSIVPVLQGRGIDVPLLSPPPGAVAAGYISAPLEVVVALGERAHAATADEGFGADAEALGREAFGSGARAIFDGDLRITSWGPSGSGNWLADIFWLLSFPSDAPPDVVRLLQERS